MSQKRFLKKFKTKSVLKLVLLLLFYFDFHFRHVLLLLKMLQEIIFLNKLKKSQETEIRKEFLFWKKI